MNCKKNTLFFSVLIVLLTQIMYCYLPKQAVQFISYYRKAVPVEEILQNPQTPDSVRAFLELTKDVRSFAQNTLGLRQNDNYTTYLEVPGKNIVQVVSGCLPDTFKTWNWRYPVVGKIPYKGYFDTSDALKEAQKLQKKGYETLVRPAGAFSTLGFFTDPLYSYMTSYNLFSIASLLIHEQTHATIYLKNQTEFNEQLAEFVGNEGALLYVKERFGEQSEEYSQATGFLEDYQQFIALLKDLHQTLDSIYKEDLSATKTLNLKDSIIAAYQWNFERSYDSLYTTPWFRKFAQRKVNNPYILMYMRYHKDLTLFHDFYEKNEKDLARTIKSLKAVSSHPREPKEFISHKIDSIDMASETLE